MITPTELVISAAAVIFVLPATVTDVPELGTVKVTDDAELAPITAAVSLPALPVNSFRVISLPPQPWLLEVAEVADLTSTPDRTTVSTLKILEVAYQASFISEVIVVSQVIATWLPCPNSIAVVPPVPEIVTVAASVDPI